MVGGANWPAAQALLHSPQAGSLTRHVQSPCERNHKTLLRGTKKTQERAGQRSGDCRKEAEQRAQVQLS